MDTATLEILICTYGSEGLQRVARMELPEIAGVRYLVSCQDPDGEISCPGNVLPRRRDIRLLMHADRGLGLNRRHALDHADADFVLLADDDLHYYPEALAHAVEIMKNRPDLDIFAFRYDGDDNKLYPPAEHPLSQPFKGYNLTSFELAYRLSAVRAKGLNFSALTGVGAPYLKAGEETIFTERCLQAGLSGAFIPLTIVRHDGLTTGYRQASDPGVIRSTAAYIRIKHGVAEGMLRYLLLAHRVPVSYFKGLRYALQGMIYSLKHDKEL